MKSLKLFRTAQIINNHTIQYFFDTSFAAQVQKRTQICPVSDKDILFA